MTQRINQFGQPIGAALPDWQPVAIPTPQALTGRFCRLEPLDAARDAAGLYAAYASAPDGRDWTYLTEERPETLADFISGSSSGPRRKPLSPLPSSVRSAKFR